MLAPQSNALRRGQQMPLTDRLIRNASAPVGRIVKLSDGEGLQLWVKPSGVRL
jgi:hypothetical protein